MTNFELAVRVPLLMRVPWRPGSIGRRYAEATYYLLTAYGLLRTTCYRSARIVEIVSLYQTIAELAGLPPPAERLQGKSFASTFGAEAAAGQAGLAAAAAAAGGGGDGGEDGGRGGGGQGGGGDGGGGGAVRLQSVCQAERHRLRAAWTASRAVGVSMVKSGRTSWRQRSSQPPSQAT